MSNDKEKVNSEGVTTGDIQIFKNWYGTGTNQL